MDAIALKQENTRVRKKAWDETNRAKIKARKAVHYQATRADKIKESSENYRSKRGIILAQKAVRYLENREQRILYQASWNKNNIKKKRIYNRTWELANPEIGRTITRNRYARKVRAEGNHSAIEILSLAEKQNYCCANPLCRTSIVEGHHADHIMPLVLGGSNWISNIQLLCAPCNHRKGAKDPVAWVRENGILNKRNEE